MRNLTRPNVRWCSGQLRPVVVALAITSTLVFPTPLALASESPGEQTFAHPLDGSLQSSCHGCTYTEDGYTYTHTGADYYTPGKHDSKTKVRAPADGVVVDVRRDGVDGGGFGNLVMLRHTLPSGAVRFSSYAHMRFPLVKEGQCVSQGAALGEEHSTGFTFGEHVHVELNDSATVYGHAGAIKGSHDPDEAIGSLQVLAICSRPATPWKYLSTTSLRPDRLAFCDIDGNGSQDPVHRQNGTGDIKFRPDGKGPWKHLSTTSVSWDRLMFADVNGSGKCDAIFVENGTNHLKYRESSK